MTLLLTTGVDERYFWLLFPLFTSVARHSPGAVVRVCDFGMNAAQTAFLREKGVLLEMPAYLADAPHPWYRKAALADYVAGFDWDGVVWLDSDMVALGDLNGMLSAMAEAMRLAGQDIAVCIDAAVPTIQSQQDISPAEVYSKLIEGVDRGKPYYNSGLFLCRSRDYLRRWADLCRTMPIEPLFEQSAFNVVATLGGFAVRPLDALVWNMCGPDLADLKVDADGGIAGRHGPIAVLHATSWRAGDVIEETLSIPLGRDSLARVFIKQVRNPAIKDLQNRLLVEGLTADLALLQKHGLVERNRPTRLDQAPAALQALFAEGGQHVLHGALDQAADCFAAVLAEIPNEARTLANMGFVRDRQGRSKEALALFQAAIAADPEFVEIHGSLAILAANLGERALALRVCQDAIRRWPQDGRFAALERQIKG